MWLYENKEIKVIEDLPEKVFGFVYKTINKETGKFVLVDTSDNSRTIKTNFL